MRRFLAFVLSLSFLALPAEAAADTNYVALTFDDGPSGKFTQVLLDGLYDRGVKATFLLCGYRLKQYPELARRMVEEGHEIGFHGYSHKTMKGMSRRQIAQELLDSADLLPQGCSPVFLRPPGGGMNDAVRQVAQARGLAILNWSVDPRDWATEDTLAIETAVLNTIRDGDVVLLHDMTASSVEAALNIIDSLLEDNFELVTVSELARLRGIRPQPGKVYTCFPRKEETLK